MALSRFDAAGIENKKVFLTWVTESERNAAYFAVQHSLTARDWKEIGRVDAHGTTGKRSTYAFTDPNRREGTAAPFERLTLSSNLDAIAAQSYAADNTRENSPYS